MGPDFYITGMTFMASFLAVLALNFLLQDLIPRDSQKVKQRIEDEFKRKQIAKAIDSPLFKNLDQMATEAFEEVGTHKLSFEQRLRFVLIQSGLTWTPQQLITNMFIGALVLGLACGILVNSVLVGIAAAAVGGAVPLLYVLFQRARRLEKFRGQLPDALELISRVLRAGQSTSQAILAVSDEFEAPLGVEFGYCYEQQNLGLPMESALRDLARRTGILEVQIFVLAILVQRQTGGNLAELLDRLSSVIRDRFRIRGMIKSLTVEARLQAGILLFLPIFMFIVIMIVNRPYMTTMLAYPWVFILALTSEGIGALWLRKIINFDF